MPVDWWTHGNAWLIRTANESYHAAWLAAGKPGGGSVAEKRFRKAYGVPQWVRDCVDALARNDEEAFKAVRLGVVLGDPAIVKPLGD
jgi:hypothetical protein